MFFLQQTSNFVHFSIRISNLETRRRLRIRQVFRKILIALRMWVVDLSFFSNNINFAFVELSVNENSG